jgi:hypothetical protein
MSHGHDLIQAGDHDLAAHAARRAPQATDQVNDHQLLAQRPWFGVPALIVVTVVVVVFAGLVATALYLLPGQTLR